MQRRDSDGDVTTYGTWRITERPHGVVNSRPLQKDAKSVGHELETLTLKDCVPSRLQNAG